MSNEYQWSTTLGDEYTVRNDIDYSPRAKFWKYLLEKYPVRSVLEVGSNTGQNLELILPYCKTLWGVDINRKAVEVCHFRHREVNAVVNSGFDLPFKDGYFSLVFTAGVLIHQKPGEVQIMMEEIVRCAGDFVLAMEYANDIFEEISYRGGKETLFKGPYGAIYENKIGLRLLESGYLARKEGFDNVTYWLFARH
jgi:SAM-dependent methyltransferase